MICRKLCWCFGREVCWCFGGSFGRCVGRHFRWSFHRNGNRNWRVVYSNVSKSNHTLLIKFCLCVVVSPNDDTMVSSIQSNILQLHSAGRCDSASTVHLTYITDRRTQPHQDSIHTTQCLGKFTGFVVLGHDDFEVQSYFDDRSLGQ